MKNRSVLTFYQQSKSSPNFSLSDDEVTLGNREISERQEKLSQVLQDKGIKPGDTVGVYCGKTVDQVIAMLAIWEIGAIYVPLSPLNPPERLFSIINNAQLNVVLSNSPLKSHLAGAQVKVVDCGEVYANQQSTGGNATHISENAYIIYTSGTTGTPKGVVINHESLFHLISSDEQYFSELDHTSTMLQMVDFSFDVSLWDLALWLKKGCHLKITNHGQNIFNLVKTIETSKANYLCFPAPTFNLLVKLKEHLGENPFPFVKSIITTASYCAPQTALEILQLFPYVNLYNCYGPTEVTVYCTWTKLNQSEISSDLPLTIGKPISGLTGYFFNDGKLSPYMDLPEKVEAELCIAGPQVFVEYYNAPELTKEKVLNSPAGPAYRTGDAVFRIKDNIYYLGRLDDCLKINGFRVHLGEIELALKSHSKIQDAVVLVNQRNDQDVINAFYSVKEGQSCNDVELKEFLNKKLTTYMLPKKYTKIEKFPLSAAGKIDKKKIRELHLT